jgi:hypothetical protein
MEVPERLRREAASVGTVGRQTWPPGAASFTAGLQHREERRHGFEREKRKRRATTSVLATA